MNRIFLCQMRQKKVAYLLDDFSLYRVGDSNPCFDSESVVT